MPDLVIREILGRLRTNQDWTQAVQRVESLLQITSPDAGRISDSMDDTDTAVLTGWLSDQATMVPGLQGLTIHQHSAVLCAFLEFILQRAQEPEAGPGSVVQGLGWLLRKTPHPFWYDMSLPEAALIKFYPRLLQAGDPQDTQQITEQYGWMLSRFGAHQVVALILTGLEQEFPTSEIPLYLTLCEVVLQLADVRLPPGVWHMSMARPPEPGEKDVGGSAPQEGTLPPEETLPPEPAPAPPRRLQAEVYQITPQGNLRLERAFAAGQPHQLTVWIGDPRQGAILAPQDFPVERLPQGLPFYPLTITFSEPAHCPQQQVATVFLFPDRRSSTECGFQFATQSASQDFRGRLVVSYQDQVLQTLLLTGSVLADPAQAPPETAFKLILEAALQSDFNVQHLSGRDAHLLAEVRSDDLCISMQVRGQTREYCVPDFKTLVHTMSAQFEALARTPDKFQNLTDPASVDLLRVLAEHGFALYSELAAQIGSNHAIFQSDVTRIQLLSTQEALVPLELIYTANDFVAEDAPLCSLAEQALRSGQCACQEQTRQQADAGEIICPLRFWGLSRLIERHKIPRDVDLDKDLPRLNPSGDIPALQVIRSAVLAASNKAIDFVPGLQQTLQDNFQQASGVIDEWKAWPEAVKQFDPSLLLLVPHAKELGGFMALEIGKRSTLKVNRVRQEHVRSRTDRHPVALVLGCSTARADISFESCTAYFRRGGAALTVTTLSPVLARHIVPVAMHLIRELKLAAQEQRSFGAALLRARQQALADGYPAVMTLIADGNIDWKMI